MYMVRIRVRVRFSITSMVRVTVRLKFGERVAG